jgi:lipopolysaccharide/colanic/teichoic acid biosynthesis glycosyltransferase
MARLRTDTFYGRLGKRVFDLVVAVPCFLLLLVPMLAVAGAILILSGSPVLFTQERIGRFGCRFRIIKYRSMTRGAEAGGSVTVGGDPRITSIGRVLRKWKLDELPQLWNVIWGDMSLVGPRADMPGFMDQLQRGDRAILLLRPGVTGPATLAYRNEETLLASQADPQRYNAEVLFPDKVKINKAYLENLSLRADVWYILATLAAIIGRGHGQFDAYAPSVQNIPNGFSDRS